MHKLLMKILITLLILVLLFMIGFRFDIILKKIYPTTYSEYVYECAEKYNVESAWIFAIIKAESNFKQESVSSSGAIGLMQLMESTAEEVADDIGIENVNLTDAKINIELGTKYFANLLEYYEDNYNLAIAAYNAGIGTVANWIDSGIIQEDGSDIENIPYKETNNYVRKILNNYKIYSELY